MKEVILPENIVHHLDIMKKAIVDAFFNYQLGKVFTEECTLYIDIHNNQLSSDISLSSNFPYPLNMPVGAYCPLVGTAGICHEGISIRYNRELFWSGDYVSILLHEYGHKIQWKEEYKENLETYEYNVKNNTLNHEFQAWEYAKKLIDNSHLKDCSDLVNSFNTIFYSCIMSYWKNRDKPYKPNQGFWMHKIGEITKNEMLLSQ